MNTHGNEQVRTAPAVYTIAAFCDAHKISRTHLHSLTKSGRGPRLMRAGRRVLISPEAAAEWRRSLECDTSKAG